MEEQEQEMEVAEEEDSILFDTPGGSGTGSLLTPPVINLIPPTPSDVIDEDQFFDDIISDEESVAHTYETGSDGSSNTAGDREEEEEEEEEEDRMEDLDQKPEEEGTKRDEETQERQMVDGSKGHLGEPDQEVLLQAPAPEREGEVRAAEEKERPKPSFLCSAYQVAPLPEYPRKRSFNSSINLLLFTEHNLDDWSNADASCHELLRAELRLLPLSTKMEASIYQRKPGAACSFSLGGATTVTVPRSHTFHSLSNQSPGHAQEEEGSPRQRRITVASFMPQPNDQNGSFPEKDFDREGGKPLGELTTEEVCQWFSSIGLQKSLQFIREAELCGADIASIEHTTLDVLHISSLQEREQLLSAIYRELHPPSTTSQRLDLLLETLDPNDVEKFTAALVNMSKSKSSLQISSLNMNPMKSFKFSPNLMVQRNSQLMEITINGSSEEMIPDQHVSDLVISENQQIELQLCKKAKSEIVTEAPTPGVTGYHDNGHVSQNHQIQPIQVVSLPGKEEKIRELNQQVDSLQNVILQVQEIHHGLVAFCSELKSMGVEVDTSGLSFLELEQRLGLAMRLLRDKRHSLQSLRETMRDAGAHRNKPSEVCLLDQMKLNCQVFKEEISLVYINRQVSRLQTALQDSLEKACGGEWGTGER
ncbi:uncharacterized protein LOC135518426 [Oncorhynchus masou masou]|uniref:uncharacterized protein LOC135518426 n=1 Tax=Oncorhynchus masou masou TaxID=90313 RepID=UPI003182DAA1